MKPRTPPALVQAYAAAVGATLVAALLSIVLHDLFQPTPFLPFFAAVAVSAWYGGMGPGLLATALGGLVGTYLFLPPSFSLALADLESAVRVAGFLLVGSLISGLSARLRVLRVQAEAASERVAASERRIEAILSGVTEGITVLDTTGRLVYANDAAAELCGLPTAADLLAAQSAEVLSRFKMFDEDGDPFPPERLPGRRVLKGEAAPEALIQFEILATGERRWSLVSATPVREAGGDVRLAVSCFRDITARRFAEQSAQFLAAASRELSRSLDSETTLSRVAELAVPTLGDWCLVDLLEDDRPRRVAVAHADPAQRELARQLLQRPPLDVRADSGVARVLRTGQAEIVSAVRLSDVEAVGDADYRGLIDSMHVRSYVIAPMLVRGAVRGAISVAVTDSQRQFGPADLAVVQDLADRAALALDNARLYGEAQQQTATHVALNAALREAVDERSALVRRLEEVLRTRDEFLATAAHDLKNPLSGIKSTAQLVARRLRSAGADPRTLEALERIDVTTTRANELVDELLDLARLHMRRPLDLNRTPVDLVRLANDVAADLRLASDRHVIEVTALVPELVGDWDARRLRRLIANLLDNAIKYSPAGGRITVRISRAEAAACEFAVLEVEDQGVGVPSDDLPRLFERFERGSNVVGRIAGTGIGLASVRQIVDSHGGTIDISSTEGQGTRLEVRLPTTAPMESAK